MFTPHTSLLVFQIEKIAFSICYPKIWDSLPLDVRSSNKLSIFKSRLKTPLPMCIPFIALPWCFQMTQRQSVWHPGWKHRWSPINFRKSWQARKSCSLFSLDKLVIWVQTTHATILIFFIFFLPLCLGTLSLILVSPTSAPGTYVPLPPLIRLCNDWFWVPLIDAFEYYSWCYKSA